MFIKTQNNTGYRLRNWIKKTKIINILKLIFILYLLSALFDNSPYISIKFDNKVIEIFNKTKDSKIRKENWDQVYKMLEEAL